MPQRSYLCLDGDLACNLPFLRHSKLPIRVVCALFHLAVSDDRTFIHLIDIRISADGWLAGSLVIEKFAVVIPSRLKCERLKPLISDGAYRRRPFVEADRPA